MKIDELPPGSTLITANTRLSRQLVRERGIACRDRGQRLWDSPDILPRDAWLRRWWTERVYRDPAGSPLLLDPQQEQVLWEQAIARSSAPDDLLSIPATAAMAAEAWALMHHWEIPRVASAFEGLPEAEAFLGWMADVERALRANHWITTSELPQILLRNSASEESSSKSIYYAGFDELTPTDQRIFSAVNAREFQLGPPDSANAERAGFEDTAGEIAHAATWARARLEPSPGARIGIVVRGLSTLRTMVERTFDDVLHPGVDFGRTGGPRAFHISAGPPIAEAPLISTALLILRLPMGLPLADAGMLIRSPFVKLAGIATETAATSAMVLASSIDAQWRRQGIAEVSSRTPEIEHRFGTFSRHVTELSLRSSPSQWSVVFSRLLARAGWPGTRALDSTEYQALERWNRLLSEFARLDLVLPALQYSDAMERLGRMAAESPFTPDDEGDAPVQIMDVLEAAGSQFDAVWVAGLHAGAWPLPSRPNPFLPLALQRAAGAPHSSAERELKYARLVTDRLLRSAPEAIFSYPRFSREEPLRVSPLIADLPEMADFSPTACAVVDALYASAPKRLDRQLMGPAPALAIGTLQSGGMSVLADQAACPFRAFATYRLDARELDAPTTGLSPMERGTIAHAALELVWKELGSQASLAALTTEELSDLLLRSIRAALADKLKAPRNSTVQRFQVLEEERLQRVLKLWLDLERERPPFEVVETEIGKPAEIGGLKFKIKADRVDRYLSDGSHALLDYKTSKDLSPKNWDGDRPDAPQLPLYATLETAVSSVMFAKVVAGEPKLIGISESGEDVGRQRNGAPLAERIPEWRRVVDALASGFREGSAAVDPKKLKQTCRYCELGALCRVAELNRAWIEDEEADENDG